MSIERCIVTAERSSMKNYPKLFIGGCSGSSNPCCARNRQVFGTNTTSFGIIAGEVGFFIDNGTGIGNVVEFLNQNHAQRVYGLQTHFHLDHCSGIPLNSLLFKKGAVHKIFAPKLGQTTFDEVVDKSFDTQTWPVSPKKFNVPMYIETFTGGEFLNDIWVKTLSVSHPGGSIAYRIILPHGDVVIASDCELASEQSVANMAAFIAGACVVYFDVQYRDVEYQGTQSIGPDQAGMSRKDWGHSTPSMIRNVLLDSAKLIGGMPKQVIIGHHDPKRNDEDLLRFENEVKESFRDLPIGICFAREGDTYQIGGSL